MKKIFSIVLFFISTGNCFAQQVTFQKTFGGTDLDYGNSVQQTTDGGYIIAGWTYSYGAGSGDVYLIKTDAFGDTLWTKTFGGVYDDRGYSVQQTTDGGYIIAGYTTFFVVNYYDVYLIKTDANGNLLWAKSYGGSTLGGDVGYSVKQTADGGYIISGRTYSFGGGGNIYLIKTDANGDSLWTKTLDEDKGWSCQQTTDGGYIITGSFGNSNDVYLIKTDTNGNSVWTKNYGGIFTDYGYSVLQTSDGGYIISGETNSFSAGDRDAYLIKTDTIGNMLWSKTFGGTGDDSGWFVQQTIDGGYIITGTCGITNKVYLFKTDVNGDSLWTRTIGTVSSSGYSVQQTTDGGYIIAGVNSDWFSNPYDVYLIKTDSNGNSGCNEVNYTTFITTPSTQVTSPATIVSSPATIVTTPATIVGNGGTVTTLCTTVDIPSIMSNPSSEISISPNPTTNNFTITFPNTINKGSIEIYNVLGKKIFNENVLNVSQKEIHLKNIDAGIYFVKVRYGENEYCEKL
ncbi:MAG TPA: T9SS type A sorting domain-containing protein, partial [Bacteroidia bacterium]|nr:T9SS type A sorting domain-containing protein [Bacteroidia bacterium]